MHGMIRYWTLVTTLLAPLVFVTSSFAVAPGNAEPECPVGKKVATLLGGWTEAIDAAKAMTPEARAALEARMASVASDCPVGSRLADTFVVARDALAVAIAFEKACSGECPLEAGTRSSDAETARTCSEGRKLMADGSKAIHGLHQLASYAAGAMTGCCEQSAKEAKETSATAVTAVTAATPPEDGKACAAVCAKDVATRVTALETSWKKASEELAALSPEVKRRKLAEVKSLAESCKVAALVPPTVAALAEGFAGLDAHHARLGEWAKANPEILASLPEEAKKSFEEQNALIARVGSILAGAQGAMKAASPELVEGAAGTASAD